VAASVGAPHTPAAEWDAELGCVARPPVDEEPAPFPELGWRLWRARSELEEWEEDLRTLYVACTRAEDYLILSAALGEKFQPSNAWMLTLTERFDLASGRCLVPGLDPERTPRVAVYDRLRPLPPAPPVPERAETTIELPPPEDRAAWEPVMTTSVTSAEDAGRVEGAEILARRVLAAWDLRERDGWRPLLDALADDPAALGMAGQWLERFAASGLREELAAAGVRHHDVEYGLNPSDQVPGTELLRGRVDCLWQSGEEWRLLFFTPRSATSASAREAHWREWLREAATAAEAIRRQSGSLPREVLLYFWTDGGLLRKDGRRLPVRRVLAERGANGHPN
jgi:hypothetical protein